MQTVLISLAFVGMVFGPAALALVARNRVEDDF
jgi:hypothetical protein